MCGNGIRCVAKYVYDKGLTDKTRITVGGDQGGHQDPGSDGGGGAKCPW